MNILSLELSDYLRLVEMYLDSYLNRFWESSKRNALVNANAYLRRR